MACGIGSPLPAGSRNGTGKNADSWEEDFKRNSLGGTNQAWVDDVDLVFYEGHGWPGGFTFYSGHDDGSLTYQDAYRTWGDRDVEWIGLLSCSVLADSHRVDWANTMANLHLLMGFKTTAYDVAALAPSSATRFATTGPSRAPG